MPYKRTAAARRPRRKQAPVSKTVKTLVRRELRKNDKKDHPLQWIDVKWPGDYIKTTPTLLSLSIAIANHISSTESYQHWPARYDSEQDETYRQANVFITGYNYQLRFQQNEEAVTDVTTNTVRVLMYSHDDTYGENNAAVLNGGDVDQPPLTEDIRSMYSDRLFTLSAGYTEGETDDTQFVPGHRILKGFKKLNHKLIYENRSSTIAPTEGGDVRFEFQSDDNNTIGEVELFGYVRIYYRVMA